MPHSSQRAGQEEAPRSRPSCTPFPRPHKPRLTTRRGNRVGKFGFRGASVQGCGSSWGADLKDAPRPTLRVSSGGTGDRHGDVHARWATGPFPRGRLLPCKAPSRKGGGGRTGSHRLPREGPKCQRARPPAGWSVRAFRGAQGLPSLAPSLHCRERAIQRNAPALSKGPPPVCLALGLHEEDAAPRLHQPDRLHPSREGPSGVRRGRAADLRVALKPRPSGPREEGFRRPQPLNTHLLPDPKQEELVSSGNEREEKVGWMEKAHITEYVQWN